jgi:hypothetical protein
LDHAIPTVIHNPEEDMPLLARWLRRAMANQVRFWSLIAGLVVVVTGLAIVSSGLSMGRSESDAAWSHLETAKTPSERVEIAREYPKTPAEQWALLQAATEFYNQGFTDLPANRDAALPALRKALDLFDEVAREAPRDSPQARAAALGSARTLEARNELDKAIKQYEKVASSWKGTPEATEARRLAEALRRPENREFYKELYAYKPVETTLPPMGQGGLTLPPNHPPLDGPAPSTFPSPLLLPPPPPNTSTNTNTNTSQGQGTSTEPAKTEPAGIEPLLPPPPPSPAPKAEPAPAPEAETEAPAAKPASGLPSDPFTPEGSAPAPGDKAEKAPAKASGESLPDEPFAPQD